MSLLDEYAPDFFDDVKSRGRDYYRNEAVHIDQSTPRFVTGTVQGSAWYNTRVDWDPENGPVYDCNCRYFEDRQEPCKHLWALVLQAKSQDLLPGPYGLDADGDEPRAEAEPGVDGADEPRDDSDEPRVNEEPDDASDGEMAPEVEPGISGPWQVAGMGNMWRRSKPVKVEKSAKKRVDPNAWKRQLSQLTEQMRERPQQPTFATGRADLTWPAGRRVIYIIDRQGSLEGRGLVVELAHETPRRDGGYDRPRQLKIGREQIAELPDEADRHILHMLLGARRGDYGFYGYYETDTSRRFELPESSYETTLKLMCDTGRCRFRESSGQEQLKPVAWDDGPTWQFWVEIKPSPGGRYLVLDGSFRRGSDDGTEATAPPAQLTESVSSPPPAALPAPGDGTQPNLATLSAPASDPAPQQSSAALVALTSQGIPADADVHAPVERLPVGEPQLLLRGGLIFAGGKVARLEHFGAFDLIVALRDGLTLSVPLSQRDDLMNTLFALPRLPRLDLPEDMQVAESRPVPQPRLTIRRPTKSAYDDRLVGIISFDYAGQVVPLSERRSAIFANEGRTVIYRDSAKEAVWAARLVQLGFRQSRDYGIDNDAPRLPPTKLPKVVAELTREGWHVEAEGKLYRQAGEFKVQVASGIDWFELHGEVTFGSQTASLPKLLAAVRRGETSILLDDGSFGLLPEQWLKKYSTLAGMGESSDDHVRFTSRQIGFLDVLLSQLPEATFDETFTRARRELTRFDGVAPIEPVDSFIGALRAYQREGLGWMAFLRRFAFGGCLADDMGLGKTVQVLALLEGRRRTRRQGDASPTDGQAPGTALATRAGASASETAPSDNPAGPSLVVAPRSLIFNWMQEAAKFTPQMKVLDHTSVTRERSTDHFKNYDLILTTYGTLRRDMAYFKDMQFDYAVLDEAQAIKNSASESAKSARLLRADHRLALSGTPVQNHLGELWSLFEFLNPGMMGAASAFKVAGTSAASAEPETRDLLARALRPFILRRTKEQVARDLPEKMEQTMFCELEPAQRKLYDELRDHYRTSLLDRIAKEGMNKAKIQVLEALLRLRQAACHPGLIDKKRAGEGSAKLDALLAHVSEAIEEGHKVLVFSQFTSLLAIVRSRLDEAKTIYEYLDGRTRDRQARVERFQNDPECKLFLISLKAGGLGLNLTSAEYVFLLDPWWNPAVEAQAIDRAHRIGQTQRVFAYRLIAKDTVEEKVLQLQQSKKDLADAIINADNSLIRSLKRDDLEMLLS